MTPDQQSRLRTSKRASSKSGEVFTRITSLLVLFGGMDDNDTKNDTWEWDGSKWSRVADTGPAPRVEPGMVFDGTHVLLFGGSGAAGGVLGDTWSWDGKHWTQIQDIGPGPRMPAGMVYDSDRSRSVLFGGRNQSGGILGDTWELYEHS